jgi:hypothetical protein
LGVSKEYITGSARLTAPVVLLGTFDYEDAVHGSRMPMH